MEISDRELLIKIARSIRHIYIFNAIWCILFFILIWFR